MDLAEYKSNIIKNAVISILMVGGMIGAAYYGAAPLVGHIQQQKEATTSTTYSFRPTEIASIYNANVQRTSSFTTSISQTQIVLSSATSATSSSSVAVGNLSFYSSSSTDLYPNATVTSESGRWSVNTIQLGANPQGIAYDPVDKKMFVTIPRTNTIDVFNGTTNRMIYEFGGDADMLSPQGIVYNSVNGEIYVANTAWNSVGVINPHTYGLIKNISTGGQESPSAIAYSEATGLVYVANSLSNTVSVIDDKTNTLVGRPIRVGSDPAGIAYDPANQAIYVTNANSSSVTVLSNESSVITTIKNVGKLPVGIVYNPNNKAMYVAELGNHGDGAVVIINSSSNKIIENVTGIGPEPYGIAYDLNENYMVVTCGASNCAQILNATSNSLVAAVDVGSVPGNVAYDAANGGIYVLNMEGGSVSVISRY